MYSKMDTNGNSNGIKNQNEEPILDIPSWIDDNYFKDILVLDGKSKWKYIGHEVKMANEKGENYASILYRVKVIAENEGENRIYVFTCVNYLLDKLWLHIVERHRSIVLSLL